MQHQAPAYQAEARSGYERKLHLRSGIGERVPGKIGSSTAAEELRDCKALRLWYVVADR
jgi:hypothetical protein